MRCWKALLVFCLTLSIIVLIISFSSGFRVVLADEKKAEPVGEFDCLNEGLVCWAVATKGKEMAEYIPEEVKYTAKVSVVDNSKWAKKLGRFFWLYWIEGEITQRKMRLMEYHFLIRLTILKWVIPVDVVNYYMDREKTVRIGVKISRGWFLSREMKLPDYPKVKEIHNLFMEATEPAGPYMHEKSDVYPNTTTTIRSLSAFGPGGFPGSGYNSSYAQSKIAEAEHKLYKLLEEVGVRPH